MIIRENPRNLFTLYGDDRRIEVRNGRADVIYQLLQEADDEINQGCNN